MNAVIEKMYISFFRSVQNEQRTVFIIPKVYCFLLRKSTLLSILCCVNNCYVWYQVNFT